MKALTSKTVKFINPWISYFLANKLMSLVGLYFIIGAGLYINFSINILPPCLWKTFFGFTCPGCGLTTAFLKILQLDFHGAYETNFLIFILIPAGTYAIYSDFIKHRKTL